MRGHAKSAPKGTAAIIVHRDRPGRIRASAAAEWVDRLWKQRSPQVLSRHRRATAARRKHGRMRHRRSVSPQLLLVLLVLLVVTGFGGGASAPASADTAEGRDTATTTTTTAAPWSWPAPLPHPVLRDYVWTGPYSPGHRGIDLGVAPGVTVTAPADGTVRFAGIVVDRPVLSIAHDDGTVSSFEPVVTTLAPGERVARGQAVGTLSRDHVHAPSGGLHLGARVDGAYVNPLLLLGELPASILLPLDTPPNR